MDAVLLYLMATCVFSVTIVNAEQVSDGCNNPLGMKDGRIQDSQLTSSSVYTSSIGNNYDTTEGRLDGQSCWGAEEANLEQWIRVDFDTPTYVAGILLQGCPYDYLSTWVTAYMVQYGIDDSSTWQNVKDENQNDMIFQGNSDRNTQVTSLFTSEVWVTRVRISPTKWNHIFIGMRFEILGCEEACVDQLGMKDGTILDRQITASSEWRANHGPNNARLDRPAGSGRTGAWSASSNDVNQWIQVDFGTLRSVSGIVLQGRSDNNQWVTKYKVEYSNDNSTWQYIQDNNNVDRVFNANSDRNGHVTSIFVSAIIAAYIRIRPTEWHRHISMRFELLGCEDINECDSNPCINGACQDGTNLYTCICAAGWAGYNCDHAAATTRASVVTTIATSSESMTKEFFETTQTTIVALASKALAMSSGSASTAVGASIGSIVLLLIMGGVIVLVVMKRRRRQQHPESNKSQTVVQLDGPYGDTVTNIITSPPTKDSHIYAGVTGANGDAVATPPTDELYQDVSDKSSEVHQGTDETYQDITEETKGNTSAHDDDIYQDVQDNEYAYAHVDTVRDKVPSVDGNLVQIDAKSQYGGAPRSADNRNQQEGWVDNDIYAMSDEDQRPKRQTGDDNRAEGWVENDIYATSDEDHLKRQGEENDKEEGWMDNSIYATTDE